MDSGAPRERVGRGSRGAVVAHAWRTHIGTRSTGARARVMRLLERTLRCGQARGERTWALAGLGGCARALAALRGSAKRVCSNAAPISVGRAALGARGGRAGRTRGAVGALNRRGQSRRLEQAKARLRSAGNGAPGPKEKLSRARPAGTVEDARNTSARTDAPISCGARRTDAALGAPCGDGATQNCARKRGSFSKRTRMSGMP